MRSSTLIALGVAILTGCAGQTFDFDQVSTQGFTVEGVFDGATQKRFVGCTPAQLNKLLSLVSESKPETGTNRPGSVDQYALSLRPKPECFPTETTTGFWRLDFVSPDLSNNRGWQRLTKFAFSMQTNVPGIVVQPLVRVQKPNGREVFYVQTNDLGEAAFFDLPKASTWQRVEFRLPHYGDQDVVVKEVQIRVFGPAGQALQSRGSDAYLALDEIVAFRG